MSQDNLTRPLPAQGQPLREAPGSLGQSLLSPNTRRQAKHRPDPDQAPS